MSQGFKGDFLECPSCGAEVDARRKYDPFATDDSVHDSRKVWQDVTITGVVLLILLFLFIKLEDDQQEGMWGELRAALLGEELEGPANRNNPDSEIVQIEDNPLGFLQKMDGSTPDGRPTQGGAGGPEMQQQDSGNTPGSMNRQPTSAMAGNPLEQPSAGQGRSPDNRDYSSMTLDSLPGMTNMLALSDSFEQRLAAAGARSGDVRVSLMWNNENDLDLHVLDPRGEEIFYLHRRSRSGGILDIDRNASLPLTRQPVENVYWPERGAPSGTYRVMVNHYRNNGGVDPTEFVIRVLVKGKTTDIKGKVTWGTQKRVYHSFTVTSR